MDDMDANLGEYLASFNLYHGTSLTQPQLNSWINASYDSVGESEEMAEEVLVSGPTHAYDNMNFAAEEAFASKKSNTDLPVLFVYTFKNFYGFEGFAMTDDYSLHPEKSGFLIIEGVTVFCGGVQKVYSKKYKKEIWIVHLLNEGG